MPFRKVIAGRDTRRLQHRDSGSCGVLRDALLLTVIVIEGVLLGSYNGLGVKHLEVRHCVIRAQCNKIPRWGAVW